MAKQLIKQLHLQPHPEGGYYKETYRCKEQMTTAENTNRNVSTAIYYLLEEKNQSHFHRIKSDELWFFHQGETVEIILIKNETLHTLLLGNDVAKGEMPQAVIEAGCWFAARIKNRKGYSLMSCTVAPGFDFADFELAKREELSAEYPTYREVIEELTK